METLEDKRAAYKMDEEGATLTQLLCSYDFCRGVQAEHVTKGVYLNRYIVFCFRINKEKNGHYFHVDTYEKDTSSEVFHYFCGFDDAYHSLSHNYSWYALLSYYKDLFGGRVNFYSEDYVEDAEMIAAFGKL